ncbi:hypothetical protein [Endozoicomonas sp. SCSIO W0465]|uniref:hypothetical protein n=1 Tax=Endozoicomonas sp. SCSIO W0465 TaxID=2918516 RepID=UPI00207650CD|nr:hypothetical protein [Endozoicomonas sp. SCSIO W0465]USE35731.1 hypothetical protein MJO57_27295 [Endozoicomonas sp. SCSIO W0465]
MDLNSEAAVPDNDKKQNNPKISQQKITLAWKQAIPVFAMLNLHERRAFSYLLYQHYGARDLPP